MRWRLFEKDTTRVVVQATFGMYNESDHTKNPTINQVQAFLNGKTHNVVIPSKSMSLKEAKTAINKRKGALNEVLGEFDKSDETWMDKIVRELTGFGKKTNVIKLTNGPKLTKSYKDHSVSMRFEFVVNNPYFRAQMNIDASNRINNELRNAMNVRKDKVIEQEIFFHYMNDDWMTCILRVGKIVIKRE